MDFRSVYLDSNDALVILDQTLLPKKVEYVMLKTAQEIWDAIFLLKVRGAPAIGMAAAYGMFVLAKDMSENSFATFYSEFQQQMEFLNSARPTAVNLSWALKRMEQVCLDCRELPVREVKDRLRQEAVQIQKEDIEVCKAIGTNGLELLKPGMGILTHCNAGRLATSEYGTATAPIYLGQEQGYGFRVFADETRPLLQGTRLTVFELMEAGVDVTLICDNMSAAVMQKGLIDAVFVGCDRVAANGDTANKIGTALVAAAANHYQVPFYVCAPTSTIDMATASGDEIVIEERSGAEITDMWFRESMAPQGVKVFNPSFDVTSNRLITGIVTEFGVVRPPFDKNLKKLFVNMFERICD
jgi:methylthioribose-1-phosphate isomerase